MEYKKNLRGAFISAQTPVEKIDSLAVTLYTSPLEKQQNSFTA